MGASLIPVVETGFGAMPLGSADVILFRASAGAEKRFWEFFAVNIRNPNTRRAYYRAAHRFSAWCMGLGLDLERVEPLHVAAYVEQFQRTAAKPTVKQHLAALRMLFDWLVVGQILQWNPAAAVRGPRHSVKKGKTPVLAAEEARTLLDSIHTDSVQGLRDRALIGLMTYTFARVGAATAMHVEDYYVQGRRSWVRLHEKGGRRNDLPAHPHLDTYLEQYLSAAGIKDDSKGPLFRSLKGRTGVLVRKAMRQGDVYAMIRRRAGNAGIATRIGCHSFRATGITAYLKNGGRLEVAQQMAGHESPRTTGLYDRRGDEIAVDEILRIRI